MKLVECCQQIFHRHIPVCVCDPQSCVRRSHVLPGISARAPRRHAEEVDDVLANAGDAFLIVSDEKAFELGIAGQPSDKVVRNGGQRIVAA